jgi:hypothetical protein
MRDFLDEILEFIGAESLTDDEFNALEISEEVYTVSTYAALKSVLEARESVSDMLYRLAFYFLGKGVAVATVNTSEPASDDTAKEPKSEIFIGAEL